MSNFELNGWRLWLACLALGALQVLAFAPFELWPVSFLSLGLTFYLIHKLAPKAAFLAGLAFGYGVYGVGVSWVYVSLATYGGMPLWMGVIAVLSFAGILAIFIASALALTAFLFSQRFRLVAISFVWLIFEWMKSWVLTGFPWLDIGYTQTPSWLFSWAPIGGIYLVSLMVLICACLIAVCLKLVLSNQRQMAIVPVIGIFVVVVLSFFADRVNWSQPIGAPIRVGIVQANVSINEKWQASVRDQLISKYRSLSQQLQAQAKVDLLVWPETALPLYMQQTDTEFWKNITPNNTALLTGIMDSPNIEQGTVDQSYNAAVLSCGGQTQVYRKRHLVPFGEYLPLRFLFNWVLEYLELPMSDFSSWKGAQNLNCGDIKVGLSICYEDAFAAEYREFVGDATMLVNISEDAWFGDSFAPHQRRQMSQMRARELSRPMVRSANSGPSSFINERGALLAETGQFQVATLSREVQAHTGDTPFKRYGNWVISLSFLIIFGLLTLVRFTTTRARLR
ncbi:MAG: apolipoprotein N-acyltransferase [Arenicella sp.]|jgi:apolipoprotein N-acyltransferase